MSMTKYFAFELYFDAALENQILKIWNILARRQISSLLIDIGARPHIPLSVLKVPNLDLIKVQSAVQNFAWQQHPISVTLSAVGGFCTDENILFLAPIPTVRLLSFHDNFHEVLQKLGLQVGEESHPGNWFPQCTVAQEVNKGRLGDAFSMLKEVKLPLSGHICNVGLVETKPFKEYFSFQLGADQL